MGDASWTGCEGELCAGAEGGHSHGADPARGLGDATGRELQRCLVERLRATPGVRLFEKCFALDLITPTDEPGSPVMGAITHHPRYGLQMIWAKATILATGGAGQVYRETTNPKIATADGLGDGVPGGGDGRGHGVHAVPPDDAVPAGAPRSLITEAVRGEGAYLLDATGQRFMPEDHPLARAGAARRRQPRDRAPDRQAGRHARVPRRAAHAADFAGGSRGSRRSWRGSTLIPRRDLIPVHPAAHYMIGGVDGRARADECAGAVRRRRGGVQRAARGEPAGEQLAAGGAGHGRGGGAGRAARGGPAPRSAGQRTGAAGPVPIVSDIRPSDHGELDLSDVRIVACGRRCGGTWGSSGPAGS